MRRHRRKQGQMKETGRRGREAGGSSGCRRCSRRMSVWGCEVRVLWALLGLVRGAAPPLAASNAAPGLRQSRAQPRAVERRRFKHSTQRSSLPYHPPPLQPTLCHHCHHTIDTAATTTTTATPPLLTLSQPPPRTQRRAVFLHLLYHSDLSSRSSHPSTLSHSAPVVAGCDLLPC